MKKTQKELTVEKQNALTAEKLRELLTYDRETGLFRWLVSTSSRAQAGSVAGCVDSYGYIVIRIAGLQYKAHRLAAFHETGKWPDDEVDHNNNKCRSDNSWENLRDATSQQNKMNRGVGKNNKLGVKGVRVEGEKFCATIKVNGKVKRLGLHETKELASAAYAKAANDNFKEFARVA